MFDVDGAPVASPGRTAIQPAPVGTTPVTFNTTPDAPAGTTTFVVRVSVGSKYVSMLPVTASLRDTPAWNAPGRPTLNRVSSTRVGTTVTNVDSDAPGNANTRSDDDTDAVTTDAANTAPTTARPPNRRRERDKTETVDMGDGCFRSGKCTNAQARSVVESQDTPATTTPTNP